MWIGDGSPSDPGLCIYIRSLLLAYPRNGRNFVDDCAVSVYIALINLLEGYCTMYSTAATFLLYV